MCAFDSKVMYLTISTLYYKVSYINLCKIILPNTDKQPNPASKDLHMQGENCLVKIALLRWYRS